MRTFLRITARSAIMSSPFAEPLHAQQPAASSAAPQRVVLVTGASSGIGRKISTRLASQGHSVYAGAWNPEEIATLSTMRNMQRVRLDVTVASDIAAAVETVRKGERELHGVVNNAGIAILSPLTCSSIRRTSSETGATCSCAELDSALAPIR